MNWYIDWWMFCVSSNQIVLFFLYIHTVTCLRDVYVVNVECFYLVHPFMLCCMIVCFFPGICNTLWSRLFSFGASANRTKAKWHKAGAHMCDVSAYSSHDLASDYQRGITKIFIILWPLCWTTFATETTFTRFTLVR